MCYTAVRPHPAARALRGGAGTNVRLIGADHGGGHNALAGVLDIPRALAC